MKERTKSWSEAEEYDVIVIGAGFAGSFTTLVAGEKYKVLVIDKGSSLLGENSTSFNECYRLHLGFHFLKDLPTAEQCLRDAVAFAREFPDQVLGKPGDPWRQGMHYVMSNSLLDLETTEKRAKHLQELYTALVKEDRENQVFGEPKDFLKFVYKHDGKIESGELSPHVARSILFTNEDGSQKPAHVVLAMQTPESQIDIYGFRRYLLEKTRQTSKITTLLRHRVTGIYYVPNSLDYYVEARDVEMGVGSPTIAYRAKAIINCAADGMAPLEKNLGYFTPDGTVIRRKRSLLVKLPQLLTYIRSSIFSIGPNCSITNLGNSTAIITYEPVTAETHWKESEVRADTANSPRAGVIKGDHAKIISKEIIDGVARYIPEMAKAQPLELRVGCVKTVLAPDEETCSVYAETSSIHSRRWTGVERKGLCFISSTATKMTYAAEGAKRAIELLDDDFFLRKKLQRVIGILSTRYSLTTSHLYHEFRDFLLQQIGTLQFQTINGNDEKLYQALAPIAKQIREALDAKEKNITNTIAQESVDGDTPIKPSAISKQATGRYKLHREQNPVLLIFDKLTKEYNVSFYELSQAFQKHLREQSSSYREAKKDIDALAERLKLLALAHGKRKNGYHPH